MLSVATEQQESEEAQLSTLHTLQMSVSERHAVWGKAITNLVERRDKKLTISSIFVLIQKNVNYLPWK
jgi:hypothetical protein